MNGAGKTTLIKTICGLYTPTEGKVYINGRVMDEYNIEDYYMLFSAVFQDVNFLPFKISELVSNEESYKTDKVKVEDCLRKAGLWEKISSCPDGMDSLYNRQINDNGVDFSGGEKLKLSFAKALYKDAPILILDEPTASLDPIAENRLYLSYASFTKNKTSIFISHRLASTRFCDRILFMEQGEITESGTHEELMKKKGKYYELFSIQAHYYKAKEDKQDENQDKAKYTLKGLKFMFHLEKTYTILLVTTTILKQLIPYIPIYLSALIIDELITNPDARRLTILVSFAIVSSFILYLVLRILERIMEHHFRIYSNERMERSKKMMSVDFEDLENSELKTQMERISIESQTGFNLFYLIKSIAGLLNGITNVLASAALLASLFMYAGISMFLK